MGDSTMILMMNQKITNAVKAINPDAEFIIRATSADLATIDGIEWEDGTTPIAKADIEAKMIEVQTAYDSQAYARTRKAKYDLLNQDEMRYDDVKNSTTTWVDAIDAIKAAHPKP